MLSTLFTLYTLLVANIPLICGHIAKTNKGVIAKSRVMALWPYALYMWWHALRQTRAHSLLALIFTCGIVCLIRAHYHFSLLFSRVALFVVDKSQSTRFTVSVFPRIFQWFLFKF